MSTTSSAATDSTHTARASYGIDAVYAPILMGVLGIVGLVLAATSGQWLQWAPVYVIFSGSAAIYMHTTLRGKFVVWQRLVDGLDLKGDEEVLDVGCGRGMALNTVARSLTTGHATGLDIWSSHDQTGNDMSATRRNAELEGVADRIVLQTGNMTEMPFPDATFDVVVSNAAVHNLKKAEDRAQALSHIWRVTKPGGRIVIGDIAHTRQYEQVLRDLGATDVTRRSAGIDGWFGNPFYATNVVTATR